MLFLNRFCNDFGKFVRQVDVFEEGNETILGATSGIGGYPHKWREFITEIIKENEAFEWIWVKLRYLAANLKRNNWKLVLITEKRNRRFAQFCKYSRLQNFILSKKNTSSASGAFILGSILVYCLFLLLFERVLWLVILINPSFGKRGLRCATGCEKAFFFAESCNSWGDTINRNSSCGRRFLQNLANRRFRKAMIKTGFQLFLLIKWWKTLR